MPYFLVLPAFLLCILLPHFAERNKVLYANMALVSIYAVAMFLQGLPLGAMIYGVSLMGSLSQILIPERTYENGLSGKHIRITVASMAVFAGATILYSSPIDLIAIAGFTCARMAETFKDPQHVKHGYFGSASLFLGYAFMNEAWLLVGLQVVLITSILVALEYLKNPFDRFIRSA